MKPIIRTLWIGGSLSRLEKVCLASFVHHGHKVVLYVYDKVDNIPNGVTVEDASDIVKRDKIFTYGKITGQGKGSYAGFANYFRYKMLKKYPNSFWVDADMICLKPFELNNDLIFCYESESVINNAVIGTKLENNELFDELIKYCENPFKVKKWDTSKIVIKKIYGKIIGRGQSSYIPWGLTGPKALTGFVNKLALQSYGVDSIYYYPVLPDSWRDIFFTDKITFEGLADSYGLHLWNEYLRRDGVDKNAKMDADSIYEKIISRYNLDDY